MTIYKNKDVETHVDIEKTKVNNPDTFFYTEDKGTAALRLFINWHNKPVDLSNNTMQPSLDLFHSDGSIWRDEKLQTIIAEKGIVQYNIPNNVIAHAGTVKAKLFLKNDKQSVHVANFSFIINDSGVESAIAKEISVNLVDDAVRNIAKENAMDLLGANFEERLNNNVHDYLEENASKFKGPKGDKGDKGEQGIQGIKGETGSKGNTGERGPQGPKGDKGDTGERGPQGDAGKDGVMTFSDLTPQQKESLRGPRGYQGEPGPRGSTGINGKDGKSVEFKTLTQSEYDRISSKEPQVIYLVVD